jgi:hypothetical protein
MNNIILYRDDIDWRAEQESAKKYFQCTPSRMTIQSGDLVIPRFSALPFYKEQEFDINSIDAKLINTYRQHLYCADLNNYYLDLQDITPKLYFDLASLPEKGPFILKGETNSKKFLWKTHMFAETKADAIQVHSNLTNDGLLQYQKICIRQYVPLETFFIAPQNLPITREYRFFVYKNTILSSGYYWSNYYEDCIENNIYINPSEVPVEFLQKAITKIQSNNSAPNFYVIDVAKTASGEWIVIELNDGCMSGLSMNDPDILYSNLKKELTIG